MVIITFHIIRSVTYNARVNQSRLITIYLYYLYKITKSFSTNQNKTELLNSVDIDKLNSQLLLPTTNETMDYK